jgi:regulator of sigma E protease
MTIFYIILTLIVLIVLHELGHFLLAKKYGVKVEEFGVGIPPRIWGKKIGETIYSINWIPLGGFVRLYGEDRSIDDERSFSSKPIYQRALIVFGGIAAFFIVAAIVFSVYSVIGVRTVVSEEDLQTGEYSKEQIVIASVLEESPAEKGGVQSGDVVKEVDGVSVKNPAEATSLIQEGTGREMEIKVDRGGEEVVLSLLLEEEHQVEERVAGVMMLLTAEKSYPFYYAPVKGVLMTKDVTWMVVSGFGTLAKSVVTRAPLPVGMEVGGPVAIVEIGAGAFNRGLSDFLYFVGLITISLAVVNAFPIPALDGGRLVFLAVEKIKGSPVSEKIEQAMTATSFVLLIALMVFITFKDIGMF